jgi:hypothetical protein
MRKLLTIAIAAFCVLGVTALAGATTPGTDTLVTNASPPTTFAQNKQNEPAAVINPFVPSIAAAGVNEEIDVEACNNRDDKTCPFTPGVGLSGIYFSDDGGSSWMQPTYQGFTARDCLGAPVDPDDICDPHPGPIGTLPLYFENGLASGGDPAVGFGPRRGADGKFSWTNGNGVPTWRLYYANIASNLSTERSEATFKGFEAVVVSRLDSERYEDAKAGINGAWKPPVIVTKQNSALFSDHEMIAVDDAESSPFFGNVYVCNAAFRGQEKSPNALPEPIVVNTSRDGGDTWTTKQVSPAFNNASQPGRQDCQVNTDSKGGVYVFWQGSDRKRSAIIMTRSFDGGRNFDKPRVVTYFDDTGLPDPLNSGSVTFDGIAGARDGTFPTVDIANGAPLGTGATDQIVLAWSNGPTPSDPNPGPNEQARVMWSREQGTNWTTAGAASLQEDRPDFPAIAISPDGRDVYLTYMNFLQPWQPRTANPTKPRLMQGVVRHATVNPTTGAIGSWSDLNRGPTGDARGSSTNSLLAGFLGDYNYAFATNDFVLAVWNDVREAADCRLIDEYRQKVADGAEPGLSTDPSRPAPNNQCPPTFGNSDIFGGAYPDPTTP